MNSIISTFYICFLLFTGLATAQTSEVGSEQEREFLGQLELELQSMKALARQTQFVSTQDTRVRIRYDWLIRDIELIRAGVREILEKPSTAPRHLPELKGAYVN